MIWIAYFSPAGTTEQAAGVIRESAEKKGFETSLINLCGNRPMSEVVKEIEKDIKPGDCFFIGSPTYANHAIPQVMEFISLLGKRENVFAAPFITYGVVCSGLCLPEMASLLIENKFKVLGGIKIVAVHSMMWNKDDALGIGRPDENDRKLIAGFTEAILEKMEKDSPGLDVSIFDYQSKEAKEAASNASMENLKKMMPPMVINEEACIECGECESNCPTGNIRLNPYPILGDNCVLCFNCVKICAQGALTNPVVDMIEPQIRKKADFYKEPPNTQSFM